MAPAEAIKTREAAEEAGRGRGFGPSVNLAVGAAWSPNPNNPPLFLDLPVKDGAVQPDVVAKWAANAPLAMVGQYIPNLKMYHAIAHGSRHEGRPAGVEQGTRADIHTIRRRRTRTRSTTAITRTRCSSASRRTCCRSSRRTCRLRAEFIDEALTRDSTNDSRLETLSEGISDERPPVSLHDLLAVMR